jgi:hypothetical protein
MRSRLAINAVRGRGHRRYTRLFAALSGAIFLAVLFHGGAAEAATQSFFYKIEHPSYGDIGTYIESIDVQKGVTRIDARLHIVVRILGIVAYREDSTRKETWRANRLISFESITEKNGKHFEVRGVVDNDHFAVTTPSGMVEAPADISTSDPRVIKRVGPGVIISDKLGKLEKVAVSGGEAATVSLLGSAFATHHFRVDTETEPDKWEVWLDGQGVPIKFRSMEEGTPIEFSLSLLPLAATPDQPQPDRYLADFYGEIRPH